MKVKLKKAFALVMVLALALSLCGCGPKVKVKEVGSNKCGTFNVSGNLGNSGTVILNGTYPGSGILLNHPIPVKNQKYTYKRSGNNITFTKKGGAFNDAPSTIKGTYNSSNNTFTVSDLTFCEVKNLR